MIPRHQIPNALTLLRLVLAAAFFVALDAPWQSGPGPGPVAGNLAVVLFVAAAITDALDGYLARRWEVVSAFGRIMDPFCDKVLVIGALIYLAGPRFVVPEWALEGRFLTTSTGMVPAFVVLIVARELLVTSVRGFAESRGIAFGARSAGKLKMILQSVGVPLILLLTVNAAPDEHAWAFAINAVVSVAIVAVTAWSGWPYLAAIHTLLRTDSRPEHESSP